MSARPPALLLALGLFTTVPVPAADLDRTAAARALRALPWLGLLLGAVAGAVAAGVAAREGAGTGSLLAAASGLAVLALLTGGMHLDGLADTADGLASRRPAQGALAIMKRSDVGPMGVATLVLVLLLDAGALAAPAVATRPWGLPAALAVGAMTGRLLALAGTTPGVPPAHPGGFAGLVAGVTPVRVVVLSGLAVAAVALGCGALTAGVTGLVAFGLGVVVACLVGWVWRRHLIGRLGGLTGDCWGSLIELGQLACWLTIALTL